MFYIRNRNKVTKGSLVSGLIKVVKMTLRKA